MKHSSNVDLQKRRTLNAMAACAGASAFATLPSLASAFSTAGAGDLPAAAAQTSLPTDIKVTLVSMPGSEQQSMLLQNLTDSDITIERFHSNRLVFDGDLVDCNDACANDRIIIKARHDHLVQFTRHSASPDMSPGYQYLDVNADVTFLPEGTRMVPFDVHMSGNEAMLTTRANPALA